MPSYPPTPYLFWFLLGAPVAVIIIGILVYFFKPKYRKVNGFALVYLGIFEIVGYLAWTKGYIDTILAIFFLIEALTVVLGIISLVRVYSNKAPK